MGFGGTGDKSLRIVLLPLGWCGWPLLGGVGTTVFFVVEGAAKGGDFEAFVVLGKL